jgi:hypothetical protein
MEEARTPSGFKFDDMGNSSNTNSNTTFGINNQAIIVILLVTLGLSFLGINIFIVIGNLIDSIIKIFGPMVSQILSIFGYTTGSVITKTADVAGTVAKTGVDLAEESIQSVGTIMKDASRQHVNPATVAGLDGALNVQSNSSTFTYREPTPSTSGNPVQKPITANKTNWCLVGEYDGKRGCIEVGEQDKCMSGQIFPSQVTCMNPANYAADGMAQQQQNR